MAAHHIDELRIAPGCPDGSEVSDGPETEADQPEAQAEPERGGQRAVEDGDRTRSAAEQDVLGQRPVDRMMITAMILATGPSIDSRID